jgi:pimeloyl-ACP methyl ester carboxylesterase
MWDAQWESFARSHRVVRYDQRGFGRSPLHGSGPHSHAGELVAILEDVGPAAIVGVSMGARAALEAAIARPDLVTALVVVGAGLPDHDWSPEMRTFDAEEEELYERRDADAYADANLRFWVDAGRPADATEPSVRELVRDMIRRGFELQSAEPAAEWSMLVPDVGARLGEIVVPVLVVAGEADVADIHANADRLERELPNAERAVIPGAAHLPPLERPDEFDRLVLPFLERVS